MKIKKISSAQCPLLLFCIGRPWSEVSTLSLSLSEIWNPIRQSIFCWWIAYSKCLTKWFRLGPEKNTLINKCCTASIMAKIVPWPPYDESDHYPHRESEEEDLQLLHKGYFVLFFSFSFFFKYLLFKVLSFVRVYLFVFAMFSFLFNKFHAFAQSKKLVCRLEFIKQNQSGTFSVIMLRYKICTI